MFNVYRITVDVVGCGVCQKLFAGYPTREEVLIALSDTLAIFTQTSDTVGVSQADTYDNYFHLLREFGIPDKPPGGPDGATVVSCDRDGTLVGFIKAEVIGQAHETMEVNSDT